METILSKDGTRIAFTQVGQGPAVILVDGAMCYSSFGPMRPLAQELSNAFTVCFYDRRGRGESGDTLPYAVQREVEDLDALIDAMGGSAFVYGISSGAALTVKAAAQLGGKIRKLAIYEPPFTFGEDARRASDAYTRQLDEWLSEGRRGDAVELFMNLVGIPSETIANMRQAPVWPAFEAIAPTLAYDNAIQGDGSVPTAEAKSVQAPVLVLDGELSPPFMHEAADAIAAALPFARRSTLKGQTHDVAPNAIAPELKRFFSEEA